MTKINMTLYCVVLANVTLAQDRDLATVNYSHSKLKYNDTAASAKQFEAKIRFPLFYKKSNTVIGSVAYRNLSLNSFPESFGNSFQGISLQIGWLKKTER